MIARDNNLRPMRKAVHPVSGVLKLPEILTAPAQITRMHEDVPFGDDKLPMKGVRIGNRDNPHAPSLLSPALTAHQHPVSRSVDSTPISDHPK
ncbi:hypothetical protein GCM10009736_44870 [Actinomadura bangladeshensis]